MKTSCATSSASPPLPSERRANVTTRPRCRSTRSSQATRSPLPARSMRLSSESSTAERGHHHHGGRAMSSATTPLPPSRGAQRADTPPVFYLYLLADEHQPRG